MPTLLSRGGFDRLLKCILSQKSYMCGEEEEKNPP